MTVVSAISLVKKAPGTSAPGAGETIHREIPTPSPSGPADLFSFALAKLRREIAADFRQIVRDELRAHQDRQSFASASRWLTLEEACAYLKYDRATVYRLRTERKLAKTRESKDAAFAPDHGSGAKLRFDRDELDAWMMRQRL